jgi:hypothetical protein
MSSCGGASTGQQRRLVTEPRLYFNVIVTELKIAQFDPGTISLADGTLPGADLRGCFIGPLQNRLYSYHVGCGERGQRVVTHSGSLRLNQTAQESDSPICREGR